MLAEFELTDWLSMMGSFLLVIGLLVATLFFIKKMGPGIGNNTNRRMKILEIQNLGGRQKLILVSVNSEQVLISLSPQGITRLGQWATEEQVSIDNTAQGQSDQATEPVSMTPQANTSPLSNFKQLLAQSVKKQKD